MQKTKRQLPGTTTRVQCFLAIPPPFYISPTGRFTVYKPHNSSIKGFCAVPKRKPSYYEALKLRNVRSGNITIEHDAPPSFFSNNNKHLSRHSQYSIDFLYE